MSRRNAALAELDEYLSAVNAKNDFDLTWKWVGNDDVPRIEVYEEAERHVLTEGTMDNIVDLVRMSLGDWYLEAP